MKANLERAARFPQKDKEAKSDKMRTSRFLYSILRPKKEKPRGNGAQKEEEE